MNSQPQMPLETRETGLERTKDTSKGKYPSEGQTRENEPNMARLDMGDLITKHRGIIKEIIADPSSHTYQATFKDGVVMVCGSLIDIDRYAEKERDR